MNNDEMLRKQLGRDTMDKYNQEKRDCLNNVNAKIANHEDFVFMGRAGMGYVSTLRQEHPDILPMVISEKMEGEYIGFFKYNLQKSIASMKAKNPVILFDLFNNYDSATIVTIKEIIKSRQMDEVNLPDNAICGVYASADNLDMPVMVGGLELLDSMNQEPTM